jgi:hypothetical protein
MQNMGGSVMPPDVYKNAHVITSDGKNIGTVRFSDGNVLFIFKSGLMRDEEFHVPITAISHYDKESEGVKETSDNVTNIRLNLNEDEVKHGFEFVGRNKPNSDLISGKLGSSYNIGLEKESVRYEAFRSDLEKNVNPASSTDKLPSEEEYICDLCMQKFNGSGELQTHRKNQHSAATGV